MLKLCSRGGFHVLLSLKLKLFVNNVVKFTSNLLNTKLGGRRGGTVVLYGKVMRSYRRYYTKCAVLNYLVKNMFQAELCLNALERCGYSSGQILITLWLHTVIALEYSFAKVICCFTSLIRYFVSADCSEYVKYFRW